MPYLFTNNATSRLASPITSGATSLDVVAGGGALFPTPSGSDVFRATLVSADGTRREIVEVTTVATDTFTIVRAQEGTTAAAFAAGDSISLFLTEQVVEAFVQEDDLATRLAVSATNKLLGRSTSGAGSVEEIDCTAAGRAILDDADAAAQRATLGLVIGTNVQAYDAELAALAGLTSAADKGIQFTGSGTAATFDLTAAGKALLDDADAAAQRTTLGIGPSITTLTDGATVTWTVTGKAEDMAQLTIAGARTLAISGASAGFRGVIHITESGTGRSLTLPGSSIVANTGGGAIALTGTSGGKQKWTVSYDGTNYWWEAGADYT